MKVKEQLKLIEDVNARNERPRAMKAARDLITIYQSSIPQKEVPATRIIFSDESSYCGRFFDRFDGKPRASVLSVINLAGQMLGTAYILGGDKIGEEALERKKAGYQPEERELPPAPWHRTNLGLIEGYDEEENILGTVKIPPASEEVLNADKSSPHWCAGVTGNAMFSTPTYLDTLRSISAHSCSRPSAPIVHMTDGHPIHSGPEVCCNI